MSLDRFHCATIPEDVGTTFRIDGEEGRHLVRVLRKARGDRIAVFCGDGRVADCDVVSVDRNGADVAVVASRVEPCVPDCEIRIAVALPRAGGADDLLRRVIEIGVQVVIPLIAERSVQRADRRDLDQARERFERIARSSMKQSGRNLAPRLEAPCKPSELTLASGECGFIGVTHGRGTTIDRVRPHPSRALVVIGPEGGLTDAEEAALREIGLSPLSLGPLTLRVETAAAVLCGFLAAVPTAVDLG